MYVKLKYYFVAESWWSIDIAANNGWGKWKESHLAGSHGPRWLLSAIRTWIGKGFSFDSLFGLTNFLSENTLRHAPRATRHVSCYKRLTERCISKLSLSRPSESAIATVEPLLKGNSFIENSRTQTTTVSSEWEKTKKGHDSKIVNSICASTCPLVNHFWDQLLTSFWSLLYLSHDSLPSTQSLPIRIGSLRATSTRSPTSHLQVQNPPSPQPLWFHGAQTVTSALRPSSLAVDSLEISKTSLCWLSIFHASDGSASLDSAPLGTSFFRSCSWR